MCPEISLPRSFQNRCWREARPFLTAFTLVTLLASAFLGMLFAEGNRQALLWTRGDTLWLFIFLALMALTGVMIFKAFDRWTSGRVARGGENLVFLLVFVAAMQIIPARIVQRFIIDDVFYGILLLAGSALSAWSFHHPDNRIKAKLWSFLGVLGFLPFLLLANLLTFPSLSGTEDFPLPRKSSADASKPPVVLFSFDSIASVACMDPAGEIRPDLPFLHAFQRESVDFSKAMSPGKCTTVSSPNFLFQRDPEIYDDPAWKDEWLQVDPLAFTNGLFFTAKQEDYRTALVGIYLPYKQLLGELLDFASVRPYSAYTLSSGFWLRMHADLLHVMKYLHVPIPKRWIALWPDLQRPLLAHRRYYFDLNLRMQATVQDFLRTGMSDQDFLFVDMPVPHDPFVFMPDGTYGKDASYGTQLQNADKMFGGFVQSMKESGIYDRAWIVFTSDHGEWDTRDLEKNHVPLLIKPPQGTYESRQVRGKIRMWEMGPFFQAIFQGKAAEECLSLLPANEIIDSGWKIE